MSSRANHVGEAEAFGRLATAFLQKHPGEAAARLEYADPSEVAQLLQSEQAEHATPVLRRLTRGVVARAIAAMDPEAAAQLISRLDLSQAAAILARLDASDREVRFERLDPVLASELRELMQFPEQSAGSMMDPRVNTFRPEARVSDVTRRLKLLKQKRVEDIFLVDEADHLAGVVALQDVVLAQSDDPLSRLSRPSPSVTGLAPREEVLEVLDKYRVRSLPVVDFEGRILGVLRHEELMATAERAAADDLVTMFGASRDERALSPPLFAVRKRLPWLQVNLLTAFLAASVVAIFEDTIARNTALAVLLPVVAGQSGNTGAQALAVTMRGLALREIRLRHWLVLAGKESLAGMLNGIGVAITTSLAVLVWSRSTGLALVIGVSMVISMTVAGLAGAVIPMILTKLKQDPAQASSIVLTTVTDVVGFFSFLGIATVLSAML